MIIDQRNNCSFPQENHTENKKNRWPLIWGKKLFYTFTSNKKQVEAVRNLSFSVEKGQILAIIGESGSGKSTLLKMIYGLLAPLQGEVRMDGVLVPDPAEVLIPGHPQMRMVTQNFEDLNTYATVWDNISSQLSNTDLPAKNRETKKTLSSLRLTTLKDKRVADLSGGEKQRVAIAVAMINRPRVLLLDEPFNQVDASFREALQEDLLRIVSEMKLTVIMVSHDPSEVMALADQLLILRKGRKSAAGDPHSLFSKPPNAYVARLLAQANILSPEQASLLGIKSQKNIGIHRNALSIQKSPKGVFKIEGLRFKGFHRELILTHEQLEIRALEPIRPNMEAGELPETEKTAWKLGDQVRIQVLEYFDLP